jgi:hypothetical protein
MRAFSGCKKLQRIGAALGNTCDDISTENPETGLRNWVPQCDAVDTRKDAEVLHQVPTTGDGEQDHLISWNYTPGLDIEFGNPVRLCVALGYTTALRTFPHS